MSPAICFILDQTKILSSGNDFSFIVITFQVRIKRNKSFKSKIKTQFLIFQRNYRGWGKYLLMEQCRPMSSVHSNFDLHNRENVDLLHVTTLMCLSTILQDGDLPLSISFALV